MSDVYKVKSYAKLKQREGMMVGSPIENTTVTGSEDRRFGRWGSLIWPGFTVTKFEPNSNPAAEEPAHSRRKQKGTCWSKQAKSGIMLNVCSYVVSKAKLLNWSKNITVRNSIFELQKSIWRNNYIKTATSRSIKCITSTIKSTDWMDDINTWSDKLFFFFLSVIAPSLHLFFSRY